MSIINIMKAQGSLKNKPNTNYWSVLELDDPDLSKIKNGITILYQTRMNSIIQNWKQSALFVNTICYDCVLGIEPSKWKGHHNLCPTCLSEHGLEYIQDRRHIEITLTTDYPQGSEFWNLDDWELYWYEIEHDQQCDDGLPEEYPDFMVDEPEEYCFYNRYGERCNNSYFFQ